MRSSMKILVAAAATLLVAPQFAMADDIEEQLRLMNERMGQLETQLQATQDELEASKTTVAAQQDLIEKAGLEQEAQSGLSAFLSQTEFDGFVAASYTYNFTGIDETRQDWSGGYGLNSTINGINGGALGLVAPLHSNNNTFQVDQAWFGMRKHATAESRGGWAVDLVWGVGADYQGTPGHGDDWLATGDMPHLYQAYAEYLAPIAGDVMLRLGRFESLFGAEKFRQDSNFNVTRGLLWALQPVNQTGVTLGSDYENGVTWTVGVVNSYSATMSDKDNEKTFIGQAGYKGENFSVLLNGLYGGDAGEVLGFGTLGGWRDNDSVALIDLVATFDPMESLSMWLNFDYYWFNNLVSSSAPAYDDMNVFGISAAARWAFLENTGLAIRFEWLRAEDHFFNFDGYGFPGIAFASPRHNADGFSFTGTIDHALTDNLTLKVEGRCDWADESHAADNFFSTAREYPGYQDWTRDVQGLGIVELLYRF